MIKLFIILSLTSILSANYTNCKFHNKNYVDICKKVLKSGVSYNYANKFLLSYFKTKKFDEISWKYLKPKYINYHKKKEKQANNVLVKYIPKMVQNIKKYREVYDKAEKKYGVNREIISAILLKETKLGTIKPTHDSFVVFNTLVIRTNPKNKRDRWLLNMGKTNMISIIKYCYKKALQPQKCNLASSYAGAVGIPQFMPNSFIYTDSYKNKIPNLNKMEDAIMSVAKFLNYKAKFHTLIKWKKMPNIKSIETKWYKFEFENEDSSFVYEKSKSGKIYKCFTKGKKELSYMRAYAKKIMRYNNSSNYVIGVLRLAYDAHKEL